MIFGRVEFSSLHAGFLQVRWVGSTLLCGVRASHCSGLSCCKAQACVPCITGGFLSTVSPGNSGFHFQILIFRRPSHCYLKRSFLVEDISNQSNCLCLLLSCVQLFATPWIPAHQLLCPWGLSRQEYWNGEKKNTRMGRHVLLQGIFPTQGLNPGLPHCRQILYYLSHQGKPIPSPGDLPNQGIKLGSPALQVDSLLAELPGKPRVMA